ncbi:hypothetical protein [Streptomyces sp. NPDC093089]|uniref:hypothetical protein n=1 Tax=Streptomyces sp. NPDC093089 TaxID=3366024 RepID=UPI003822F052
MGIESDQLVYDYLSRVGDLAQQQHLPASDRMRLVSGLRDEIDRRRATHGEESPAAVRALLGSLGTPDEVVGRVGSPAARPADRPVPGPRPTDDEEAGEGTGAGGNTGSGTGGSTGTDRRAGAARTGDARREARGAAPGTRPTPVSVPRPGRAKKDWWQKDAADAAEDDEPPVFAGGIERPDLFAPPREDEEETDRTAGEPAPAKRRRLARVLRLRKGTAPGPVPEGEADAGEEPDARDDPGAGDGTAVRPRLRLGNPFLLLAALLLLGGALFGSLLALAAGWLLAYASRRLTPAEAKTAVLVLPGLAATAGAVWLWGRVGGRWGAPVAQGGEALGAAISETWPWTLKGAAVVSALFLLWRSRRH